MCLLGLSCFKISVELKYKVCVYLFIYLFLRSRDRKFCCFIVFFVLSVCLCSLVSLLLDRKSTSQQKSMFRYLGAVETAGRDTITPSQSFYTGKMNRTWSKPLLYMGATAHPGELQVFCVHALAVSGLIKTFSTACPKGVASSGCRACWPKPRKEWDVEFACLTVLLIYRFVPHDATRQVRSVQS